MELRGRCGVKPLALSKEYKSATEGSILHFLKHSIILFTLQAGPSEQMVSMLELFGGYHCCSEHLFFF